MACRRYISTQASLYSVQEFSPELVFPQKLPFAPYMT